MTIRWLPIVAPALASQFEKATVGQLATAMKQLGFDYIAEAAMGADMVAKKETEELAEKGFLTSSCCPAFVSYIRKHVPELSEKISHNLSPMAEIGRFIKINAEIPVKTVFIGPCTAKKQEMQLPSVDLWIDCVLTFDGRTIYYHSDCGTFNERLEQGHQSLRLSDADRETVNAVIQTVIPHDISPNAPVE